MKKIPLLLAGLVLAGSANAAVLQFDFTAKIQEMVQFSPLTFSGGLVSSSDLNGSTVALSDAVSGHFTYDTTTAQISNVGGLAMFSAPAAQNALNAAIGSNNLALANPLSNTTTVQLGHNVAGLKGADTFGIANVSANGQASQMMALMLFDSTGHAFSGNALPATLDFSAFGTSTFYYTYSSASTHAMMGANGSLTSLTVTQLPSGGNPTLPVPEPETYAMLLAGLGVLGWTVRRRQAR